MPALVHAAPTDGLARIAAAAGDYPLDGPHVAVVGPALRRAVVGVAGALDVPLLVAGEEWAWLATTDGPEVCASLGGAQHAVGLAGPCTGPDGFRAAHRRASLACAGAALAGRSHGVATLADVTLEALVAGDAEDAREIVLAELGPLAAPGPGAARLRATLEAALAAGAGRDGVAARLGVAPRTVSYRLRRAEQLLGHAVADRRAELAVALRLHRALG